VAAPRSGSEPKPTATKAVTSKPVTSKALTSKPVTSKAKAAPRPEPPATGSRSNRRTQLLRVSLTLFREHGYHGTGINDIGKAAGVTGPAIYRHFDTKDDLLVAAIVEGADRLRRDATEVLAAGLDAATTLRRLCESYASFAVDDPDLLAVFLFEARHIPTAKRDPLRRNSRRYAVELARLLREARPSLGEAEALATVGAALFTVTSILFEPPRLPPDRLRDLLADRMAALLLTD
jgi:AcrR family transcriptional regulator